MDGYEHLGDGFGNGTEQDHDDEIIDCLRSYIRYVNLKYPPEIAQKFILDYELNFYEADRETAMLAVTDRLKRMFEK